MAIVEQEARVLDFPELPLWIGSLDSMEEPVEVVLLSDMNNLITGKLSSCKYEENSLLLNNENANQVSIALDKIAYLQFSNTCNFPPENPVLLFQHHSVEIPIQNKPFKITLKNGHILEGEMKSYKLDSAGVHIYSINQNQIIRYFVPHSSVVESKLGDKIGEELLESNVVTAKHVSKALFDQATYKNKKIGEYLVEKNIITDAELEKVLRIQNSPGNSNKNLRIGDLIVSERILSRRQIDNALDIQKRKRDEKIGDILVGMGYATSFDIQRTLSRNLCMPLVDVDEFNINSELTKLIPYELAKKNHLFPLEMANDRLIIACYNPLDRQALDEVSRISNHVLEVLIATKEGVENAIRLYYGNNVLADDIEELEEFHFDSLFDEFQTGSLTKIQLEQGSARPVIKFINDIFFDALARNALAIHFIPGKHNVELNYLIGEKLLKQFSFHKALLSLILARFRIIGGIEFPDSEVPQEGISFMMFKNKRKAFHISILPTLYGASIALRFIHESENFKELDDFGYNEQNLDALKSILDKKDGLILFTSHSLNTVKDTMYSVLRYLQSQGRNIAAIEDFSEQSIDGITQIQIGSFPGYSAEQLLWQVHRFNPGTIMLGDVGTQSIKAVLEIPFDQLRILARVYKSTPKSAIDFLVSEGLAAGLIAQHLRAIVTIFLIELLCDQCLTEDEVDSDL